MSPKGYFDEESAEELIAATRHFKAVPPGSVKIHYDSTGFFTAVFEEETQVLDALKGYMAEMPAYNPRFFRVAPPAEPKYSPMEIALIVPVNPKAGYDFDNVLARLVDNSEHMEFRPGYGPEVYTGLVKEKDAGKPLGPVIDKMNEMVRHYEETSKPIYCAKKGFVDEVVRFGEIRRYMVAFAGSIYQNPRSICPHHHMLLPRLIRSQVVTGLERPA